MKTSIISEMFHGRKGAYFNYVASEREETLMNEVSDLYDKLTSRLNECERKLFERFLEKRESAFLEVQENTYVNAFKIGINIGFECKE